MTITLEVDAGEERESLRTWADGVGSATSTPCWPGPPSPWTSPGR
ncbi:hypothetical protein [Streptomyces sp. enrichment culture]